MSSINVVLDIINYCSKGFIMRKLNVLIAALIGPMLVSCNHGGTVDNAIPQPPVQGTTFELLNETKSIIKSIKIKDDHGNLIYSKDKLNCQPGDFCEILAEDLKLKSSYDAFFFNENGKVVSVYDFQALSDNNNYQYIYANNSSLGIYLYTLIRQIDTHAEFEDLMAVFGNKSNQYSPFELLGIYYQQQINTGKVSDKIISNVAHAMIDHKVLSVGTNNLVKSGRSLLTSSRTTSAAASTNSFCSSGMKTVLGLFEAAAKGPLAPIAILTKVATSLQYSVCPEKATDSSKQFLRIETELRELRDDMYAIRNGITQIADNITASDMYNIMNSLNNRAIEMNSVLMHYHSFLNNQPDGNGRYHQSLQSFMASYGGINNVVTLPVWNNSLDGLYRDAQRLRNHVQSLNAETQRLRNLLNTFCASPERIPGSVISRRIQCNYYTLETYVGYSSIANAAQQALQDMLDSTSGIQRHINFVYLNNQAALNSDFNSFQTSLRSNFGSQSMFYNPIHEIEPTLGRNIQQVGCTASLRENGRMTNYPYITDWHTGANPYVTVKCPGNQQNTFFTSRYQYRSSNGANSMNPRNVMGVLVPREFFTHSENINQFNTSGDITHGTGIKDGTEMWYRLIAPQNTRIYSTNLRNIADIVENRLNPHQFHYSSRNGTWNIMVSINNNLSNVNVYENRFNDALINWTNRTANATRELNSFIRFTDESGVSRVWNIRPKYVRNFAPVVNENMSETFSQQCMTYDCSASNVSSDVSFSRFIDFPQRARYGWSPSPSGILASSYMMTVDGTRISVR